MQKIQLGQRPKAGKSLAYLQNRENATVGEKKSVMGSKGLEGWELIV